MGRQMIETVCKIFSALIFCLAIGVLIPLVFVDFPETLEQIGKLPIGDAWAPGKLGFLIGHLAIIAISTTMAFLVLWRSATLPPIVVWSAGAAICAMLFGLIGDYWLGYLNLIQSGMFLWLLKRRGISRSIKAAQ
jgi:hypothetical protein